MATKKAVTLSSTALGIFSACQEPVLGMKFIKFVS